MQTTTDADGGGGAVTGYDGFEGALGMSGLGSINCAAASRRSRSASRGGTRKFHFATDMSGAGRWRGGSGHGVGGGELRRRGVGARPAPPTATRRSRRAPRAARTARSRRCTSDQRRRASRQLKTHRMHSGPPGEILGKVSRRRRRVSATRTSATRARCCERRRPASYVSARRGPRHVRRGDRRGDDDGATRRGARPRCAGRTASDCATCWTRMWLIRAFEEKVSELYAKGELKGLLHLGDRPGGRRRRHVLPRSSATTTWSAGTARTPTRSPRARTSG